MVETDGECWLASDEEALQFWMECSEKMKLGNCKHDFCFPLIMFPLRVADSGLDSHPKPVTDATHQLNAI